MRIVRADFWAVYPAERKVVVFDLHQSEDEPSATWLEGDTFSTDLFAGIADRGREVFREVKGRGYGNESIAENVARRARRTMTAVLPKRRQAARTP